MHCKKRKEKSCCLKILSTNQLGCLSNSKLLYIKLTQKIEVNLFEINCLTYFDELKQKICCCNILTISFFTVTVIKIVTHRITECFLEKHFYLSLILLIKLRQMNNNRI